MADKKITELTEATQLQDNDIFPIVQNSETKRITVANARAKFKGDKGENGQDGQQGPAGVDGKTPVKGVDYFTEEDINSLNIPKKTSDLTNDSGFITSTQVKKIEIVTDYPKVEEEGVLYMKVVE